MIHNDRQISAIILQVGNEDIFVEFFYEKPYEKVMEYFLDYEFWYFLEEFSWDQKKPLKSLEIRFDENTDDLRVKDFLEHYESWLNHGPIFKVRRLLLNVLDLHQAISILKHLDPEFIRKLEIQIRNLDRKVDIENLKFVVDWKKGRPIKLVLRLDKVFEDNLKSINKIFLNWNSFTEVELFYKSFDSNTDPLNFFDVPFKLERCERFGDSIKFRPSSKFRLAPSIVKLTLSSLKSAEVLENPVILERIIGNIDFFDMHRLRKTSSGIRTCVDHLNCETDLNNYRIFLKTRENATSEVCYYTDNWKRKRIEYKKSASNSEISDFLRRVLVDFELNMRTQKTCLNALIMDASFRDQPEILNNFGKDCKDMKTEILENLNPMKSEFISELQKILKARPTPLKVRNLDLYSATSSDVMQILPYLDSKSLKRLEIRDPCMLYSRRFDRDNYPESLKIPFDLEEISKTEQWRNATVLDIHCVSITAPIQNMNLTHFSKISISSVQTMTTADFVYLKENLMASSTFESFVIYFREAFISETLSNLLGEPHQILEGDCPLGDIPIPNSREYMEIYLSPDFLNFERVKRIWIYS